MKRKIALLTDGKAGHENQAKAFVRALGCEPTMFPVAFRNGVAKAASYVLDRLGVRTSALFSRFPSLRDPALAQCAAVVGAGSGTFYAAKVLSARLGIPCAAILMPRGYSLRGFACIMAPSFDRPPKRSNIVEIPANLVAADPAFYRDAVAAFRSRATVEPDIAVVIGGPNAHSRLDVAWLKPQLDAIFRLSGRKAVTTSRRTPPDVEVLVDSYPWDWKLIYSRDSFNPVPAFVALAKRLYVTAESTGMLSEACSAGAAEVCALDNLSPGQHKFRRFLDGLRAGGHVGGSRKIDLSAQMRRAAALLGLEPPEG